MQGRRESRNEERVRRTWEENYYSGKRGKEEQERQEREGVLSERGEGERKNTRAGGDRRRDAEEKRNGTKTD